MKRKDPVAWLSTSLDIDNADDEMEVKGIENERLINREEPPYEHIPPRHAAMS